VAGSTRCTLVLRVRTRACVPEPCTDDHAARDERDSVGLFSVETVVSPAVSYRGFGAVVCMFQEAQSDGRTD
jgi:hypothetical protein